MDKKRLIAYALVISTLISYIKVVNKINNTFEEDKIGFEFSKIEHDNGISEDSIFDPNDSYSESMRYRASSDDIDDLDPNDSYSESMRYDANHDSVKSKVLSYK